MRRNSLRAAIKGSRSETGQPQTSRALVRPLRAACCALDGWTAALDPVLTLEAGIKAWGTRMGLDW